MFPNCVVSLEVPVQNTLKSVLITDGEELSKKFWKEAGLVFPMDSRNKKVEWTLGTTRQVLNRQ